MSFLSGLGVGITVGLAWSQFARSRRRNCYGELTLSFDRGAFIDWLREHHVTISDFEAKFEHDDALGASWGHLFMNEQIVLRLRMLSGVLWLHASDNEVPIQLWVGGDACLRTTQDKSGAVCADIVCKDSYSKILSTTAFLRVPWLEFYAYAAEGMKNPLFGVDKQMERLAQYEKIARAAITTGACGSVVQFSADASDGFQVGIVYLHYREILNYSPG